MSRREPHKFACPECGADTAVYDTAGYSHGKAIWRRRKCTNLECANRITTWERTATVEEEMVLLAKEQLADLTRRINKQSRTILFDDRHGYVP
jgi:transcriptional regulator NrdR family protein